MMTDAGDHGGGEPDGPVWRETDRPLTPESLRRAGATGARGADGIPFTTGTGREVPSSQPIPLAADDAVAAQSSGETPEASPADLPGPAHVASGGEPAGTEPRRRLIERLRRTPRVRRKLADILTDLANDAGRDRVSVGDLIAEVGGARAFGALLLVFALPNALPAIPGTSGILGLPLLFLTFQLMLGRPPWLPAFVTNRSLARDDFGRLVGRINPWLTWADRLTAPRLSWLVTPAAERLAGLMALIFAILVALPIPLGNMLPATAICMIALGLLERDGLWVLLGWVVGALSVVIVSGVVWAMATATWLFLQSQFGIGGI